MLKKNILSFLVFLQVSCFINALPLFQYYKELEQNIPHITLAQLPTPIYHCHNLERMLNHNFIFMKRDDLTGPENLYGGNKVRKLEFLLAQAIQENAQGVITFGCVGTNHGLATACYAHQLGLDCVLMVTHQPNSPVVRQNLLLDHYFNAEIYLFEDAATRNSARHAFVQKEQKSFHFIPTGGSTSIGCLGYVNAALELKEQIVNNIIPEPDYIYVPIGSCGTTAGLLLGLQLAGIQSKIIAVTVQPEKTLNIFSTLTQKLFAETNKKLNQFSAEIPLFEFPHNQLIINKDFCGQEYGQSLKCTDNAAQLVQATEGIAIEITYSAKAFAALISDIENNIRKPDEVLLLWNTYCGLDFSSITKTINYKELNSDLHCYFERM